jgi:P-type E1-E2 ATPase
MHPQSSHLSSKFSLVSNAQYYRYLLNSHNQNPDSSTIGIQQVTQSKISNNFHYDLLSASTTTAFVSLDGKIIGCILLEDKLRKQAKEALSEIKSMGINLAMLTGDNENIAKRIAL